MNQISFCVGITALQRRGFDRNQFKQIQEIINAIKLELKDIIENSEDHLIENINYPELVTYLCRPENLKDLIRYALENTPQGNAAMRLLTESTIILKTIVTGKFDESYFKQEKQNKDKHDEESKNQKSEEELKEETTYPDTVKINISQIVKQVMLQDMKSFLEGKPIDYSYKFYENLKNPPKENSQNESEDKSQQPDQDSSGGDSTPKKNQLSTIEHDDEIVGVQQDDDELLQKRKADIEIDLDAGDEEELFSGLKEEQKEEQKENQQDSDAGQNVEEEHLKKNTHNQSIDKSDNESTLLPSDSSRSSFIKKETTENDSLEIELKVGGDPISYDVGNAYLDQIFNFLEDERDVHQDSIKNFCTLVRSVLRVKKLHFLNYFLKQKKGSFLFKILPHLSQFRFELLLRMFLKDIQVVTPAGEDDNEWFTKDQEDEQNADQAQNQLTPEEQELTDALAKLQSDIILKLINSLHSASSDLNMCLTAQAYLILESKSKHIYPLLIQTNNIKTLIRICCDFTNEFQQYALHVLAEIINQFPTHDRTLDLAILQDFQHVIGTHFLDLTYSCLLIIRSPDVKTDNSISTNQPHLHINQAGSTQKRLGIRRLRALELIYEEMKTLQKYEHFDKDILISSILRKQFLKTVLYVMKEYEYSNVGLQIAYKVIVSILDLYDEDDVNTIIKFISEFFSTHEDKLNKYESGRNLESMNQASILRLVFTVGRLIDEKQIYPLPDKKKDRYDEIIDFASLCPKYEKYRTHQQWVEFRQNKLEPLATRWNKEIIEYIKERELAREQQKIDAGEQLSNSDENKKSDSSDGNLQKNHVIDPKSNSDSDGSGKKDSSDEADQLYGDNDDLGMLIKQYKGNNNRRDKARTLSVDFKIPKTLIPSDEDLNRKNFRDDWGLKQKASDKYFDNSYWKVPDTYNIDELLEEQQKQQNNQNPTQQKVDTTNNQNNDKEEQNKQN